MKRPIYILLILFLAMPAIGHSQKQSHTTANYKAAEKFLPDKMKDIVGTRAAEPNFIGKTDNFWYVWTTSNGIEYYYFDAGRKKVTKLFDRQQMAGQMSLLTHMVYDEKKLNVKPKFSDDGKSFTVQVDGMNIRYELSTGRYTMEDRAKPDSIAKKDMTIKLSKDNLYALYAFEHNIWLERLEGDLSKCALTEGAEAYFSFSFDETESGGRKSLTLASWIGGTHKIYALRTDNRKRKSLPVLTTTRGRPTVREHPYYFPGEQESPQYDLVIADADTRKVTIVDLARWKDQKVIVLDASEDGSKLFIERKKRTCDELEVCVVDMETGDLKVLFNEVCKPYFNEQQHAVAFLNGGQEIIWWSERTGKGHYYLLDGNGVLKRPLTEGDWIAGGIVKIDTAGRQLYIEGYAKDKEKNPYYAMIYRVDLDGRNPIRLLSPEDASHQVVFSPSGRYFIDNYSRVDLIPKSVLRDNAGRMVCELGEADLSRLLATGWKMPERFSVKAADGLTDLYGVMWKPADFDSTRRYPIISHVYPGPKTEAVDITFTITGNNNAALAQVGFIVVSMGHRGGSPVRDKAYHTYGYNNLRDYALADDKYGLEQLADRYDYIDIDRVGIFGHSGGGFMSAAAICTYPDFYKAAVSSSGNHNNNMYNRWWVESHHGVKEVRSEGKDGNAETRFESKIPTNMDLARNLKGHLLLITGDSDENVHPAHTMQMVDALVKAGKNFDMYVFPDQRHFFQGEYDYFHRRKIWFYFAKYLLGDIRADYYYEMNQYQSQYGFANYVDDFPLIKTKRYDHLNNSILGQTINYTYSGLGQITGQETLLPDGNKILYNTQYVTDIPSTNRTSIDNAMISRNIVKYPTRQKTSISKSGGAYKMTDSASSWVRIYSMITSSVILPEVATKYPRPHK